jgi:EAL domain-containing protein (putative c-di-GMP-specific phosphodiesterase class I)
MPSATPVSLLVIVCILIMASQNGSLFIWNSGAMSTVRLHPYEKDRLDSLYSYQVLDTGSDPAIDALTRLAAQVCETPFAGVSLIDSHREWFKSIVGGPAPNVPREQSFCSDVVATESLLQVRDAAADPRYAANPLVSGSPRIRGYAGAPLIGRDGLALGALCVIDQRPRRLTGEQLQTLTSLAAQVITIFEERRRDLSAGMLESWVPAEARHVTRLRRALEAGELVPHYQPLVDIVTGSPNGLEALLRWEHPVLGTLLPSDFLPLIESGALVVPVGRMVLDSALAELAKLRKRELRLPGGMFVNVASGQLSRPGLAAQVFDALDHHGIAPDLLGLEITETTGFVDARVAVAELNALADAGVRIVLDDYGVGWSNMARLLQLPVSTLKLDGALIGSVRHNRNAAYLVRTTVTSAFHLGLDVVAEGIEDAETRRFMMSTGCRWAQGWLFGRAVPAASLPAILRLPQPRLPRTRSRRLPTTVI